MVKGVWNTEKMQNVITHIHTHIYIYSIYIHNVFLIPVTPVMSACVDPVAVVTVATLESEWI